MGKLEHPVVSEKGEGEEERGKGMKILLPWGCKWTMEKIILPFIWVLFGTFLGYYLPTFNGMLRVSLHNSHYIAVAQNLFFALIVIGIAIFFLNRLSGFILNSLLIERIKDEEMLSDFKDFEEREPEFVKRLISEKTKTIFARDLGSFHFIEGLESIGVLKTEEGSHYKIHRKIRIYLEKKYKFSFLK